MTAVDTTLHIDHHGWWRRKEPYSKLEIACDIAIHCLGIAVAAIAGGALLFLAATRTAPAELPAIAIYVSSLVTLLLASLAFNVAPVAPIKRFLARLDQAAIFLLIAGTYTPVLAMLSGTGPTMLVLVWGASLVGIALKLFVPERFGRIALALYAAVGWSGIVVFKSLAEALPPSTLGLLLAGGVAYSSGIIFHLWQTLRFHNALWHCFVVLGASLHLWAIIDCMVLRRL
jgi:hemolysin III